jgi:hypothetical protein
MRKLESTKRYNNGALINNPQKDTRDEAAAEPSVEKKNVNKRANS